MKLNDDQLVEQSFAERMMEVEDNGFTKQVMKRLPQPAQRWSKIWTVACWVAVIFLFFLLDGVNAVNTAFMHVTGDLSGMLVSFQFDGFSPFIIYLGVLSTTAVIAYNVIESPN